MRIVMAPGVAHLRRALAELRGADDDRISELLRRVLVEMSDRLRSFEQRLAEYDRQITDLARRDDCAVQLMAVPGVGPLTATALIAAVGDAQQFKSGRQLSAWLGLVPRKHSSGERKVLLGISKRGDRYLRTLLIHGARSALHYAVRKRDRRSVWVTALRERSGANIAAVALANKNTRVLWALLSRNDKFRVHAAA
jgi:transposase